MEDHRPVPYEELHWESFASLNPIKFRGLRVSITKLFSKKFSVTHNMNIPADHCQYAAKYIDPKGTDCRALLQLGNGDDAVLAGNYIQRVSPGLSLGGEFIWTFLSGNVLGIGCAARYETDKMVASAQVDTTGRVHMSNLQKISKEASLAGDFIYNLFSRDVQAGVGCDYNSGQSRVRGKIDSNGVASALLEERTNMGLKLLLSAELDLKKNYKFGFGIIVG